MAATCEFPETNEEIWDQLIDGCQDVVLRKKFLEKTGIIELKSLTDITREPGRVNARSTPNYETAGY